MYSNKNTLVNAALCSWHPPSVTVLLRVNCCCFYQHIANKTFQQEAQSEPTTTELCEQTDVVVGPEGFHHPDVELND